MLQQITSFGVCEITTRIRTTICHGAELIAQKCDDDAVLEMQKRIAPQDCTEDCRLKSMIARKIVG